MQEAWAVCAVYPGRHGCPNGSQVLCQAVLFVALKFHPATERHPGMVLGRDEFVVASLSEAILFELLDFLSKTRGS